MKYARIIDDVAQEVIDFDPAERFHPDVAALFEPVPDEVNQGATRDDRGAWTPYVAPAPEPAPPAPEPAPPAIDPTEWLIDIGPFFDRFGAAKMDVLMSSDATVKAIVQDVMVRKWVDLQRSDVGMAIAIIGSIVPSVSAELKTVILSTPVSVEENRALRKVYFS